LFKTSSKKAKKNQIIAIVEREGEGGNDNKMNSLKKKRKNDHLNRVWRRLKSLKEAAEKD